MCLCSDSRGEWLHLLHSTSHWTLFSDVAEFSFKEQAMLVVKCSSLIGYMFSRFFSSRSTQFVF